MLELLTRYYRADGSCNNLKDGSQGQAGRPHKRLIAADYADKRGEKMPSFKNNFLKVLSLQKHTSNSIK